MFQARTPRLIIGRYNSCPPMGASQRSSHESHRIFLATNLGRPFFFTETYKTDTAMVRNPSRRPSLPNPASLILPQSRRSPPPPIPSWLTRRLPIFRMNSSRRHRRDEGQAAAHAPSHLAGMKGRPPLMPPAISPLAVPTRRAVAGRSVVRGRQMQSSPQLALPPRHASSSSEGREEARSGGSARAAAVWAVPLHPIFWGRRRASMVPV
jgi:hypothetical protein